MIPLGLVFLVANFVQAILYGLYIATFNICIRWLIFVDEGWQVRSRKTIQWSTLTLVILLFIFSTVNLGASSWMVLAERSGDRGQGLIIHILGTIKSIMESASLIIMDAVLIYRCWILYGKLWRIVLLPLLLWTSTIACAMVLTFLIEKDVSILFPNKLALFPTAVQASLLVCNLATNLYATCAILYRVLSVAKESMNPARALYSVCQIVAGTGVLYALTSFTLVVSIFLQFEYIIMQRLCLVLESVNFSMAGIAFNLLLIRVRQLRSDNQSDTEISC